MQVTALGHAGLEVETSDGRVLIDPWLSPEGAFEAAWFQYPENAHLATPARFAPAAVVVSHEHLDHLDPWVLARIPAGVPIVVPRYPSATLRRKVEATGPHTIVELAPWEPFTIGGTRVFVVPEASPMNHDAAVVVSAGGRTLLDLNDARLFPVQLRAIRQAVGGVIDVFACQGAGASWYPMRYGYPPARRAELSRRKRLAKLAYVERALRLLEPGVMLPFGGPPCFLAPDLFAMNREMDGGIFPDQAEVAAWLADQGLRGVAVLRPGDAWDAEAGRRLADGRWDGFTSTDREAYLAEYAERRRTAIDAALARHPEPAGSLREPFREYFARLLTMSPYFNAKIGMRVGFEVTGAAGGCWSVDFRPGAEGVRDGLEGCGYVLRFAARWLPRILAGEVPWEDFFLSLRFEARRDPDLYNDHLLGLLKFAEPAALDAVERFETAPASDERITVRGAECTYRVGRYCPHAGTDLLEAGEILPGGVLRCLAHHYEFDLETGRCTTGVSPPLAVERVDDDPGHDARRPARHTRVA